MALNNPYIATLEAKRHFLERCQQNNRTKISLLITGKSAVGKSSLVNALGLGTTCEVTSYRGVIEGVNIRFLYSPGLDDGTANNEKYLAEIRRKITEELDLVIFCVKMEDTQDDTRIHRDDKDAFKILTGKFGKNLWKNAVIALTFANKVEGPTGGDRKDYFQKNLSNWREVIHSFLRNTLKLDPEVMQSLPIVPTGYYRQTSVLPSGANWLSEFWISCYCAAGSATAFGLYHINRARVRFSGSEEAAAIRGGSEVASTTPGLDNSKILPIGLDEEQQESPWNTTWEAFKNYCSSLV